MSTTAVLFIVLALAVGAALGAWLGWRMGTTSASARSQADVARAQAQAEASANQLATVNQQWSQQIRSLQEQLQHERQLNHDLSEANSAREAQESANTIRILNVLTPVEKNLKDMRSVVADMEKARSQQWGALGEQIQQTQRSTLELQNVTKSLDGALRNSKTRGTWGEAQLQSIVEAAGMVPHVDFDVQVTTTVSQGSGEDRRRPDMVIHLPGGKSIPVDSKVPLEAWLKSTRESDPQVTRQLLAQHNKAVRDHVSTLAKKAYWEGFDHAPDFTIAFMPSEALVAQAMEADPDLLEFALKQHIVLASPSMLWALLRTLAQTWRDQALTDQAQELLVLCQQLYERIGVVGKHAGAMRSHIEGTVKAWNGLAASLENRLLVTARKLGSLEPTKTVPSLEPIDQAPHLLTAPELLDEEGEVI